MDLDRVSKAVGAYLENAEGADAARLRFFEGLWEVQAAIPAPSSSYEPIGPRAVQETLSAGKHIFEVNPPEISLEDYLDALSRIVGYVKDMAGLPEDQISALEAADFASVIDEELIGIAASSPDAFIEAVRRRFKESRSEDALSDVTLAFVLTAALTPFLEEPAARSLAMLDDEAEQAAKVLYCPVCGSAPTISQVGEGTKEQGARRTLWCGVCHAEWPFERIRCARCGTRSYNVLRYTHVEGDPAHRLHLCDECHGYIRTVFRGDTTKPLAMPVEDLVMAELDAIAREQGYTVSGDKGQQAATRGKKK